jgi:hypothetical protein
MAAEVSENEQPIVNEDIQSFLDQSGQYLEGTFSPAVISASFKKRSMLCPRENWGNIIG